MAVPILKMSPWRWDTKRGMATRTVTYVDGTVELRGAPADPNDPGTGEDKPPQTGDLLNTWVDESVADAYKVKNPDAARTPTPTAVERGSAPPQEKDEGGRRQVFINGEWIDVGPAPPNAAERAAATAQENRERQTQQDQIAAQTRADTQARQATTDERTAQARQDTLDRQAVTDQRTADQQARANAVADRPGLVSGAPSTQRTLTERDPTTGAMTAVPNPSYDEAKALAEEKKAELALQIQLGNASRAQAADEYKRWFDQYIDLPFKQAAEARAKAKEIQQAQNDEDQRQHRAAEYERQRQTSALGAGQTAITQEQNLLPYTVGPAFGEQYAEAVNSLARGSGEGINFTKDAFEYKRPDYEGIAARETARALSTISPYAQNIQAGGERPLQVASYEGIPSAGAAPPPPAAASVDFQALADQYLNNVPYNPEEEEYAA